LNKQMSDERPIKDVLVFETNEGICGVFDIIFSEKNWTFDIVRTHEEILQAISVNRYRTLIIDDSIDVKTISSENTLSDTTILKSTSQKSRDDVLVLKRSNIVVKPFVRKDVEALIQKSLQGKR